MGFNYLMTVVFLGFTVIAAAVSYNMALVIYPNEAELFVIPVTGIFLLMTIITGLMDRKLKLLELQNEKNE